MRYRGKPHRAEWSAALEEFRRVYNEQRPHEALQMQRPAERYRASARAYQAQPQEWEYPLGSTVRRLKAKGFSSGKDETGSCVKRWPNGACKSKPSVNCW